MVQDYPARQMDRGELKDQPFCQQRGKDVGSIKVGRGENVTLTVGRGPLSSVTCFYYRPWPGMSKATSETCVGNRNVSVTPLPWVEYVLRWEMTTILTSCLVKYFRHPSLSDKRNLRGRNCPLSRPRFQRMPSFSPRSKKATFKSIPSQASELHAAWSPSHTAGIKHVMDYT